MRSTESPSSQFFLPSGSHTILVFLYDTLLTVASNAGGVGTNRDSRPIYGYRSMTAGASAVNN